MRFEQVGVVLHFIAQFRLQLVEVGFVGLVEFGLDVGKIDDVAVAVFPVGAVDAGECLEEVVGLDDAAEVESFLSRRASKPGEACYRRRGCRFFHP